MLVKDIEMSDFFPKENGDIVSGRRSGMEPTPTEKNLFALLFIVSIRQYRLD